MVLARRLQIPSKKYGKVKLLWQENYPDGVLGIAMAEDGSLMYVSCYDRTHVFNKEGEMLNSFETDGFLNISTTENGKYALVTTLTKTLLLSPQGYKTFIEKPDITSAKISRKGEIVVTGIKNVVECFNLKGEPLWEYDVKEKIWVVDISAAGKRIAVGTAKEVYCFDFYGKMEWRYRTGNLISDICISADGELIVASSGKLLYLFNKRGQVLWSKEVGTVKSLSASDRFELISVAVSTKILAFNLEGDILFQFSGKDFINTVTVSAGGEAVIAGTGSEIFNKSEVYCFERNGELLWRYDTKGNVNVVETTKNGEYVGIGDSKRVYFFDTMMVVYFMCSTLTSSAEEKITNLEKLGLKLEIERKELEEAKKKIKDEPLASLRIVSNLERELTSLYNKYQRGRKELPEWIKTLGLSVKVSEEQINEILPVFAEYSKMKRDEKLQQVSAMVVEEMALIKNIIDAVNSKKLGQVLKGKEKNLLKERLNEAKGAYNSLFFEKNELEALHTKKVQFLMNLEDQIRNVFLDIISKRSYKRKISKILRECNEFSKRFYNELREIQERVEKISEWTKHDTDQPEDTEIYVVHEVIGRGDKLLHHITIENNYDYELKDLEIWCFANRGELRLEDGEDAQRHIESIPKNTTTKVRFSYKFINRPISGIHGFIAFSPPKEYLEMMAEKEGVEERIKEEQKGESENHQETKKGGMISFGTSTAKSLLEKLGLKRERSQAQELLSINDEEVVLSKGDVGEHRESPSATTKYLKFSIINLPGPEFFVRSFPLSQDEYSRIMDGGLSKPWQRAIELKSADAKKVSEMVLKYCSNLYLVKESKVRTKKGTAFVYWLSGIAMEKVKVLLTVVIRQRKNTVEVGFSSYCDERSYVQNIPKEIIKALKKEFVR